jgi:hypothetical protein
MQTHHALKHLQGLLCIFYVRCELKARCGIKARDKVWLSESFDMPIISSYVKTALALVVEGVKDVDVHEAWVAFVRIGGCANCAAVAIFL